MTTPPSFAEIRVEGADSEAFLHSQLANDIRGIAAGQWRYGSYCATDGRVQSLLMIARASPDRWCLLLPADLLPGVLLRLQRHRLRARCTIAGGAVGIDVGEHNASTSQYQCAAFAWRVTQGQDSPMPAALWSQQLALGIPWLLAATSERFLPQMLSLERLQAYSLRKGCFPGQEVVARTHYLGRAKRRLVSLAGGPLDSLPEPGAELCLQTGTAVVGSLLACTTEGPIRALAVVGEDAVVGSFLCTGVTDRSATFVIERDIIETIGDGVLNGPYHPPFGA